MERPDETATAAPVEFSVPFAAHSKDFPTAESLEEIAFHI
jgi:hypothetical protein